MTYYALIDHNEHELITEALTDLCHLNRRIARQPDNHPEVVHMALKEAATIKRLIDRLNATKRNKEKEEANGPVRKKAAK